MRWDSDPRWRQSPRWIKSPGRSLLREFLLYPSVAFALLGALLFSIVVSPVLASFLFRHGAKEWHNPLMRILTVRYRKAVRWSIRERWAVVSVAVLALGATAYLALSGIIGSEPTAW